jgi:uridine kinase/Gpi18-like mannosyltransferase
VVSRLKNSYRWNSFNILKVFVVKLFVLGVFSSQYSTGLFMPFVDAFTLGNNPWQYYYENNLNLDSFPYHGLMLYIHSPTMWLANALKVTNPLILNFLFKLPLVFADIILFITLLKLFPLKEKQIFYFYLLNPIVIYAIYIHSQLDIIPMAFFVAGVYFLSINRLKPSAILIGFALATKLHILIGLPLLAFYLLKKHRIKKVIAYFLALLSIIIVLDLPYLFSDGFIYMVLMNPKQYLLFDSYYQIGTLKLLLPLSSIFMIYLHFFNQKKINQDLLFFYFGILFTAIIFFIYPAPAWYVWIVPFVSIFFIQSKNNNKARFFYILFSLAYLVFFIFFYKSEYKDILFLGSEINLKINSDNLTNISFTFLEMTLLGMMYAFYKHGIKSNSVYKKQSNLTIGIGGDSGVGKTRLLDNLSLLLGNKLLKIEGDGEHKWERGDDNWKKFTHLDPKANHIHKQANAIHELKQNNSIFRNEYDHTTGKFSEPLTVEPREFIAISGLHPFYLPKLRKNIDLKIYIDTNESLRRHWKIIRDTKKRGYSVQKVVEQIDARVNDTIKYIYPQKNFADLEINFFSINELILGDDSQHVVLGLKMTVDANLHLEEIFDKLECDNSWDYNEDLTTQFIILNDEPRNDFSALANQYIPNINEIIVSDSKWLKGYSGFIQLISLVMISEKLKEAE